MKKVKLNILQSLIDVAGVAEWFRRRAAELKEWRNPQYVGSIPTPGLINKNICFSF
jgi:hypothetical protein